MKNFKSVKVSTDGSFYVGYRNEAFLNSKFVVFQKHDDKSFGLNRKDQKQAISLQHSFYYLKTKYFK